MTLGTTLLQSTALFPKQVEARWGTNALWHDTPSIKQTLPCSGTQSQSKMRL